MNGVSTLLLSLVILLTVYSFIAADDSPCWRIHTGRCQYTSEPCLLYNSAPLCGGPNNRQCCVLGADIRCHRKYSSGVCLYTSSRCRGGFDSADLCGGGNDRQCCRHF
ncbi:uncharacterized protein LOC125659656 [Ostrea edulis]|uniref:uncharacterized protein LOC125659656 n=1 Tax=Ostrea edulis TaxID=37623 RepID=UPI0020965712|nr:uncharacterized protein LOC125659656 [Ostrea edulis]